MLCVRSEDNRWSLFRYTDDIGRSSLSGYVSYSAFGQLQRIGQLGAGEGLKRPFKHSMWRPRCQTQKTGWSCSSGNTVLVQRLWSKGPLSRTYRVLLIIIVNSDWKDISTFEILKKGRQFIGGEGAGNGFSSQMPFLRLPRILVAFST